MGDFQPEDVEAFNNENMEGKVPLGEGPEPIAIVGMACRWPGGVSNPSQLWDMLQAKRSGYSEFPEDRFNIDGWYHPEQQRPGSFFTRGGFFLEENPRLFDHNFFGMSPLETRTADVAQRKLLEVTFEAFENAGIPWEDFYGSKTGVYVGNFCSDHQNMQFRDADYPLPYMATGGDTTILSNRVNYTFDLKGPSVTMNTACSSSMYALHLAINGIRNGDCDGAIVAGSNIILEPASQIFISKLGAISPTSISHTFDASADGYARADGFGSLYLVPLSRALTEGHNIRAVIRGSAISANGRSDGISHPSAIAQEAVIRQAYINSGHLDPAETDYFECHGTGTPVGDPLEVAGIGKVFAQHRGTLPLLIGSVKPNLGHSESASAIASIMKVILAIERDVIPPTRGITKLNPNIDFEGTRTEVVQEMRPWPRPNLKRASINSFGYGGSNAHVILEHPSSAVAEYISRQSTSRTLPRRTLSLYTGEPNSSNIHENGTTTNSEPERPLLFVFSAKDETALQKNVAAIAQSSSKFHVSDLAYTLISKRSRFSHRSFAVATAEDLGSQLAGGLAIQKIKNRESTCQICLVFTGQGAQWPNMGRDLFHNFPVFRDSIRRQDAVLSVLPGRPKWTIEDVVAGDLGSSVHEPAISQTVCTSLQIALVDLLLSFGIQFSGTVGHSSGEIAATYAAGKLSAAEAVTMAFYRGYVVGKNSRTGTMLAVGIGYPEIEDYLGDFSQDLVVAAINSPSSTTISGRTPAIEALSERLSSEAIFNRILKTGGNAYHSPDMALLGSEYERLATEGMEVVRGLQLEMKTLPPVFWVSSVHPWKDTSAFVVSPKYWRKNLESPVQFNEAVRQLQLRAGQAFQMAIEIGPHAALQGPLKQIFESTKAQGIQPPSYTHALSRGKDDVSSILVMAGRLFQEDCQIDLEAVNSFSDSNSLRTPRICLDMPTYSYSYGPIIYHENRINKEWRLRKRLRHDLLGVKQPASSHLSPSWRNILRVRDVPWLADHKLIPQVIFPGAGFLAMAAEAFSQHYEDTTEGANNWTGISFRNVAITSTLEIPDDELGVEVILSMQPSALESSNSQSTHWFDFQITALKVNTTVWVQCCSGSVGAEKSNRESDAVVDISASGFVPNDMKQWYRRFEELGLGYGEAFQGLNNLLVTKDGCRASINLDPSANIMKLESAYRIHPATIDACLQLALIASHGGNVESAKSAFVPVMIDSLSIWNVTPARYLETGIAIASGARKGPRGLYAKSQLISETGEILMDMGFLKCISYQGPGNFEEDAHVSKNPLFRLCWKPDIDRLPDDQAKILFPVAECQDKAIPVLRHLEELAAYMIISISEEYRSSMDAVLAEEHVNFVSWTHRYHTRAADGKTNFGLDALDKTHDERAKRIEEICEYLGHDPEMLLMKQIYDNRAMVLTGKMSSAEIARNDDLLENIWQSSITFDRAYEQLTHLVDLCAHKNPHLRILEINAGMGLGPTGRLLSKLESATDFKRYKDYTLTSKSPSFITGAQERFAASKSILYNVLDIDRDPQEQGLEAQYDLVIASRTLHATDVLSRTVQNCRKLLKEGGKLVVVEMTRPLDVAGMLSGTFPGFWRGHDDCRPDGPFVEEARWHHEFATNGFSGIDLCLNDYPKGFDIASVMMTTATEPTAYLNGHATVKEAITILGNDDQRLFSQQLINHLDHDRYHITYASLIDNIPPQGSHVISLLDLEDSTNILEEEASFVSFKEIVRRSSSLLWLTKSDMLEQTSPTAGLNIGLLRTLPHEMPHIKISQLCLGSDYATQSSVFDHIKAISTELVHQSSEGEAENYYTLQKDVLHVSRVVPDTLMNAQYRIQEEIGTDLISQRWSELGPMKVAFGQAGLLSTLHFEKDDDMHKPLAEGWVEIRTEAIEINMKDLAVATGRFDLNTYSLTCCGIVTKLGAGVNSLVVGDRVCGMAPGNFGNFVRTSAVSVQKFDKKDKPEQVASLPVSYITAVYSLMHLARLQKGEKVLIQSATSALGMALIRIARHLGGDIYVTVGASQKADVLVEQFGISRERVFASRDHNTWRQLREAGGMDVILSSSSGEHMQESWRCVAPMGRFIEMGRLDVINRGKLAMEVFERNATFSSFDIGLMHQQKPEFIGSLMEEVAALYRKGIVKSIDVITTFEVSQLEKALVFMGKGTHVGKVVVTYTNPDSVVQVLPSASQASFDPDAAYILTGCSGLGVGYTISSWLIARGARHLYFMSRSGAPPPTFLGNEEVRCISIKCDVTIKDELDLALAPIKAERQVKGVVHAAAVFEDVNFESMTYAQLRKVIDPKVRGTINLHEATLDQPLDFFTMTSSIVSVVNTATQSSYSAANSFQDAFARFRRARNLPALSLAMGMISDVGFASRRPDVQRSLQRNGVYGTTQEDLTKLLDIAFTVPRANSVDRFDPWSDAHLLQGLEPVKIYQLDPNAEFIWSSDPRFSRLVRAIADLRELRQLAVSGGATKSAAGLGELQARAVALRDTQSGGVQSSDQIQAELRELAQAVLVERVAKLLFLPAADVDVDEDLTTFGIDSMVGAELRGWLMKSFGLGVTFGQLVARGMKIRVLVGLVVEKLTSPRG
ncbi:hypothetical protein HRS9122_06166 [Pyrenophora teres f. teres]|nr:hypothetical protein HRS9122_06166 [Pyrenophora teres f. teres]